MSAPAFGWSAGDIAVAIRLIYTASKAFKDTGGTVSGYEESVSFLNSLEITLTLLEEYTTSNPDGDYSSNIAARLKTVNKPWNTFRDYLEKYEKSLSSDSTRSNVANAPRKVQWAIKELDGEVAKLKTAVSQPLNAINTLLALGILYDSLNLPQMNETNTYSKKLANLPNEPLSAAQTRQLIETIQLPDIPADLDSQISTLRNSLTDQGAAQNGLLHKMEILRQRPSGKSR